MAIPALLGAGAKVVGGSIVKSVAKDKVKNFIQRGKKSSAIERVDTSEQEIKKGALIVRPQTSLVSPSSLTPPESPGDIVKVEKNPIY